MPAILRRTVVAGLHLYTWQQAQGVASRDLEPDTRLRLCCVEIRGAQDRDCRNGVDCEWRALSVRGYLRPLMAAEGAYCSFHTSTCKETGSSGYALGKLFTNPSLRMLVHWLLFAQQYAKQSSRLRINAFYT